MHLDNHIKSFLKLGKAINNFANPTLEGIIQQAYIHNNWFEINEIKKALSAWSNQLTEEHLIEWTSNYTFHSENKVKSVGLIMAGNIPLVGLHDLLSVLITNHKALVKLSSKDTILMTFIIHTLYEINEEYKNRIEVVERIQQPNAIIATGSNNSARYFETYFGKYPNIIRKSRTSIALLNGQETQEELKALGHDIFSYFGLGCRNITKIYIPEDYKLDQLFEALDPFKAVMNNNKYKNNYDYNCTLLLMNKNPFLNNNFIMFKEDTALQSATAIVHYERYKDQSDLENKLADLNENAIQCISSNFNPKHIDLGKCQQPQLWDYADNIDTIAFLLNL